MADSIALNFTNTKPPTNADLRNYRQTVLVAFQQVEDAMSATRIYSQQILQQEQAVKAAQQFFDLEMERYRMGLDPFVTVVIAQTALLNNQTELNTLHVQEMLSSVQLVEALGGGWDHTQLPTPSQLAEKVPASTYTMQK